MNIEKNSEHNTLYITTAELDPSKQGTPSMFHGAVERAFGPRQPRNLWRIDPQGDGMKITILSVSKPNMDNFMRQFGRKGSQPVTEDYLSRISDIRDDMILQFKVTANPTYREYYGPSRPPKILAYTDTEGQLKWLRKAGESHGFKILTGRVLGSGWLDFMHAPLKGKKNRDNVTIATVRFSGTLKITDAEQFRMTLIDGIGRGKAYGAGLLTVTIPESKRKLELLNGYSDQLDDNGYLITEAGLARPEDRRNPLNGMHEEMGPEWIAKLIRRAQSLPLQKPSAASKERVVNG